MTIHLEPWQSPPSWSIWGMSAGRGAGKTEAALRYFNRFMKYNIGYRGLIVVPTTDDIRPTAERLMHLNTDIEFRPSIRRLIWRNWDTSEHDIRLEEARMVLARLQDLPEQHIVRRKAEQELKTAEAQVAANPAQAFIAAADQAGSIHGVQSHITFLSDMEQFPVEHDPLILTAADNARIATRLGLNPQIIITHLPSLPKPWPEDTIYTIDAPIAR